MTAAPAPNRPCPPPTVPRTAEDQRAPDGTSGDRQDAHAALARGLSNRQIARELGAPGFTVQDHLKALVAKLAVSSRSELVAAVFFRHHAPHTGQV